MQSEQKPLRRITIVIFALLVVATSVLLWRSIHYGNMGKLNIVVAPDDISLVIDNKKIKTNRLVYVTPGAHTWEAARQDFTSKKGTFSIKKGESQDLGIYLQPANDAGRKWLADHAEQGYKIESQVGNRFTQLADQAVDDTPLIKSLPFTAPGSEFVINYGSGTVDGKPKTTIYIDITSDQAKEDARTWIKQQGTNPDTLNIVYNQVASENDSIGHQ